MVEVLGLKAGDDIEVVAAGRQKFVVQRVSTDREVLERLRKYRGRLPPDFKFDRLEANER